MNVPSAVWIDEAGKVIRIDEGAYATTHTMGTFSFGREDYAPIVRDWVKKGAASEYAQGDVLPDLRLGDAGAQAEAWFKLGVYFFDRGDTGRADRHWATAQQLRPDSWNYHRQDWSFTPGEAGANWQRKVETLGDKPYYRPVPGL